MPSTVAGQFVEYLVAAGFKCAYGIVGDSLNGLSDAIRRQRKVEWIHVRHEEVVGGAEVHWTGYFAGCTEMAKDFTLRMTKASMNAKAEDELNDLSKSNLWH